MRKYITTLIVSASCVLGALVSPALASAEYVKAYTPWNDGGGFMVGAGQVLPSNNQSYQNEACLQVREQNGNFININGSCQVNTISSGFPEYTVACPYVRGHTYRTWAWAGGVGSATSGWWTP